MRIHRRRARKRRGSAVIEMALIAPVLIMMIFGQLEVMRMGMAAQLLTNAAREGCRVAALSGNTDVDVRNRVNTMLAGSGINIVTDGTIVITPPNPNTTSLGDPITVSVAIPYSKMSWSPIPSYLRKNMVVRSSATMSSERPGS